GQSSPSAEIRGQFRPKTATTSRPTKVPVQSTTVTVFRAPEPTACTVALYARLDRLVSGPVIEFVCTGIATTPGQCATSNRTVSHELGLGCFGFSRKWSRNFRISGIYSRVVLSCSTLDY